MAAAAIDLGVLAGQWEIRFTVVKTQGVETPHHARGFGNHRLFRINLLPVRRLNLPTFGRVAGDTVRFEVGTMRILCQ